MMPVGTVTKEFEISAAHWLPHHDGKCKNLHGHNYRFEVTVAGGIDPNSGMIVDFGILKEVAKETIGEWDHALLTHWTSPPSVPVRVFEQLELTTDTKVVCLGVWTTAENLSVLASREIARRLKARGFSFETVRVKVWETPDSCAESMSAWWEE